MPVDVRSMSLAVTALLACIFVLHWTSAVFIPLMWAVMSSYALSPAVGRLQRLVIARVIGAARLLFSPRGGPPAR